MTTIEAKKLNTEDLILYILNKLEPEKSDKIRLNKLAFFAEFAFLHCFNRPLSTTEYAGIDLGPVIDNYDTILKGMQKKGSVKIDGYRIRPLTSPSAQLSPEDSAFVDAIIAKYSSLTNKELIALSHSTDSYRISTDNEKRMGGRIDKKLALLETFIIDDESQAPVNEDELPAIDRAKLLPYDTR